MASDALECVVRRSELVAVLVALKPLIESKKESAQHAARVELEDNYLVFYASRQPKDLTGMTMWSRLQVLCEYQAGPVDLALALTPEMLDMIIGAFKGDDLDDNLWLHATRTRLRLRSMAASSDEPPSVLELAVTPPSPSFNDVAGVMGAVARSRPLSVGGHITAMGCLGPVVAAARRVCGSFAMEIVEGIQGRNRAAIVFAGPLTCVIEAAFEGQSERMRELAAATPSMPRWGDVRADVERDIATAMEAAAKAAERRSK